MRKEYTFIIANYEIRHTSYTDSYLVYCDDKFITVYRSLRGAKAYIAKKLKLNYKDLYVTEIIEEV